jgi:hypothetical protein
VGHAAFARNAVLTLFVATHARFHFLFSLKCSRICQTTHPFFFGILPLFFGVHALPFFLEIFPLFYGAHALDHQHFDVDNPS